MVAELLGILTLSELSHCVTSNCTDSCVGEPLGFKRQPLSLANRSRFCCVFSSSALNSRKPPRTSQLAKKYASYAGFEHFIKLISSNCIKSLVLVPLTTFPDSSMAVMGRSAEPILRWDAAIVLATACARAKHETWGRATLQTWDMGYYGPPTVAHIVIAFWKTCSLLDKSLFGLDDTKYHP